MKSLSRDGQQPEIMVVTYCDAGADPALILKCNPGDFFVRNASNIIPSYKKDEDHHGTSFALESGVCFVEVSHLKTV